MENKEPFEKITKVFGVGGFAFLAGGAYLFAGDVMFGAHAALFDIDRREFSRMNYYGMGFFKLLALVCFFLPDLSLEIVGRSVQ